MKVELFHHTPIEFCISAIRTCYDSHHKSDNGGQNDFELLERVGHKLKHESVIEHIVFHFFISDLSRAALQELARHRMASLSVKSTRYTIKRALKKQEDLQACTDKIGDLEYIELLQNYIQELSLLNDRKPIPNDQLKYMIPECFNTDVAWTINFRSLLNFLELRTSPQALAEMQELSQRIIAVLPFSLLPFYNHLVRPDILHSKC